MSSQASSSSRLHKRRSAGTLPVTQHEVALVALTERWLANTRELAPFLREQGIEKTISVTSAQRFLAGFIRLLEKQADEAARRVGVPVGRLNRSVYLELEARAGRLVAQVTTEQRRILVRVMGDALRYGDTQREIAAQLRQVIGLTEDQAMAVRNFYKGLREAGYSQREAAGRASGYSRRLRRVRSNAIARTEASFAYNRGREGAWRLMQERGLLPVQAMKVWNAAGAACQICSDVDGEEVPLGGFFTVGVNFIPAPPAHVNCRCIVDLK